MAYNLPPPWDPGFALPSNVRDEGLERRGFVTKQMPRGTYDAPNVGTGGYAVPKYVMDEGYGQGTFVTKWMPRGTRPNVPHYLDRRPRVVAAKPVRDGTEYTVALSGSDVPALYQQFGQRAAAVILERVARVPAGSRKATLKQILDTIDPTLWSRTATAATKYQSAGLPAPAALARGLADTLSTGIAAEIVRTGLRRAAPRPRSLLGLGCYGRQALGATTVGFTPAVMTLQTGVLQQAAAPQQGQCDRDGRMVWDNGAWRRIRSGEKCSSYAGVGAGAHQPLPERPPEPEMIEIGPGIKFPVGMRDGAREWIASSPAELSQALKDFLRKAWAPEGDGTIKTLSDKWGPNYRTWLLGIGFSDGQNLNLSKMTGLNPSVVFKHPITKEDWVLRLGLQTDNGDFMPPAVGDRPLHLRATAGKADKAGVLDRLLGAGAKVAQGAHVVVQTTIDLIGDLACAVANNPNAVQAGAAAGTASGVGAPVGAAGAAIAQRACYEPPPEPPPPPPGSSSVLPVAMVAGGVVLAGILLTRKKKAP